MNVNNIRRISGAIGRLRFSGNSNIIRLYNDCDAERASRCIIKSTRVILFLLNRTIFIQFVVLSAIPLQVISSTFPFYN
jgi:hypothetical protein